MPSISQLPTELLLKVAAQLDGPSRNNNLRNLALTSRQMCEVAQDVLFAAPCIDYHELNENAALAFLLARTMNEQPRLAKKVKHLDMITSYKAFEGSYRLARSAFLTTRLAEIDNIILEARSRFVERTQVDLSEWLKALEGGTPTSFCGACLAFAPSLRSLDIQVEDVWRRDSTHLPESFLFDSHIGQLVHALPSFTTLTSLTTDCPLPWELVSLPNLQHLQFRLNKKSTPYNDVPKSSIHLRLTSLIIGISDEVLVPLKELHDGARKAFAYITHVMLHMSKLQHLALRITREYPFRSYPDTIRDWTILFSRIPLLESLETLEIDAAEIRLAWMQNNVYEEKTEQLLKLYAAPPRTLEQFPNLRLLVVPQSVILDEIELVDGPSWMTATLPETLQAIEIIDSTELLTRWASRVLSDRYSLPALSRIVLWSDRKMDLLEHIHLVNDVDRVWDEIRNAGVTLQTHSLSERLGWRRCQEKARITRRGEL